jgi:activator of 2-hydroxyglutaryl-CoA dehydratase
MYGKEYRVTVALDKELRVRLLIPEEPQVTRALGAALYAME